MVALTQTKEEIKIVEGVHERWGAGGHEYWLPSRACGAAHPKALAN